MRQRLRLSFAALAAVGLVLAPATDALAKHKKKWPAKKSSTTSTSSKSSGSKSDEDDDAATAAAAKKSGGGDDEDEDAPAKPKAKTASKPKPSEDDDEDDAKPVKKKAAASEDEDEDKGDESGGDDEGETPVVRKKARKHVAEEAEGPAMTGLELAVGSRALHRTFDFNDPLSAHNSAAATPDHYALAAGPVPFIDVGLYPGAFAGRGIASQIGIVGGYERLIGTSTVSNKGTANETTTTTTSQQYEVGLRGRTSLGDGEVGLTAAYGQQSFRVSASDAPPANGTGVPNVQYTFFRLGLDGRVPAGPISLGAHVGTRLVPKVGPLATQWFATTKTTSIEAGISASYALTPMFDIVVGADFLRYAFDFNPVRPNNPVVAGGAVDQYISGYLALRVAISGS
ncbi:MAG TPA: hypothetical protein VHJ20_19650 [Polyangia bacterium]|nr:hypothetical protein [Polyangia bacterium]